MFLRRRGKPEALRIASRPRGMLGERDARLVKRLRGTQKSDDFAAYFIRFVAKCIGPQQQERTEYAGYAAQRLCEFHIAE